MLMTREMDYALRILRALYQDGQLSAAAIAEKEHTPKAVTLKILKQLHAAGIVTSRRGPSGGYLTERPCEELYLGTCFRRWGRPSLSIAASGPAITVKTSRRRAADCAGSCPVFRGCWKRSFTEHR